eukprot:TRINITY_DN14917_c0_g1_i2.p1 TRINITY_DN14917_c0_g1~~TRINITY_DN14917_c0_g1_i2.p1  ORF type:complete len:201 (-),score=43.40 TRINITY_DN14917_c0_g1_i2:19-621(-)
MGPGEADPNEAPLFLLTAEEKISELSEIIEKQKENLQELQKHSPSRTDLQRQQILEAELNRKQKELLQKEREIEEEKEALNQYEASGMTGARESSSYSSNDIAVLLEREALGFVAETMKEIKQQKDQYRMYPISQNLSNIQKVLSRAIQELKGQPRKSLPPKTTSTAEMRSKEAKYQDPTPTSATYNNVRKALREYYLKK